VLLSKKEQRLIDRLKASGRAINDVQLNASFRFIVRPFTTVGIMSVNLASWLEDEIFSTITWRSNRLSRGSRYFQRYLMGKSLIHRMII
jgi:hypothetical protein